MLDKVNSHNVSLLSGLFRERADLNRNYLLSLTPLAFCRIST